MFGYDYVLSVEHEDSPMSPEEGLTKAVRFLDGLWAGDQGEGGGRVVGVRFVRGRGRCAAVESR
jgi:hypothetical protein